jgi:hypothetical protein
MGPLVKKIVILRALHFLLSGAAWAAKSDVQRGLSLKPLAEPDVASYNQSITKVSAVLPRLAGSFAGEPFIFERQEEVCPPETPIEVGGPYPFILAELTFNKVPGRNPLHDCGFRCLLYRWVTFLSDWSDMLL